MKKKVTILLVLFLAILVLPIPNVLAQAYTQFSLPATYRYGHPQLTSLTMSNGKYVYVYSDTVTDDMYVRVYSAQGVLLGSINWDYKILICSHGLFGTVHRITVAEIDEDEILVVYAGQVEPANQHENMVASRVNIATFGVVTHHTGTEQATNQGSFHFYTSQIFRNGTYLYGIVTYDYLNDGAYEGWLWRYDMAGDVFADTYDNALTFAGQVFGFHDPDDNEMVYVIAQVEANENQTCLLKWDLNTYTVEPELLANAPFADLWYFVHQSGNSPQYEDRYGLRFIGAGKETNATTDKYFLWFTWAVATSTSQNIQVIQHRLQFNGSGIDALYLENNNRVQYALNPDTGFPTLPTSVHGGFHQQNDKDTFFVISESRYAINTYYQRTYTMQMNDWYTFGATTLTTIDNEWNLGIYDYAIDNIGDIAFQEPTSTMASVEEYAHSYVRIYFNLDAQFEGYDVDALTYTPADANPEINKRYVFSSTVTLNDIGYQTEVSIYLDDIVIASRETESDGDFSFWVQSSVLGAHNITVEVFDNGVSEYTETTIYVWVASTADEDTQLINLGMGGVVNFIILFALCGVPAFLLMQQAGMMGFFAGLALGAVIGYTGGIMPMYGLMLVGLICAVGMIYGRRTTTAPNAP